ncbi:hypothetical protein NC796_03800 [Aliifodinibius sp. S!AR15-10]|uniref:hypothetical protein n=1 Tax=Aliifodinibius sp. S!AR15-10 TaxID=2950437 RepID=UPI0028660A86|nr:hypothetical protein [Aliifodinibius sp. S!AR15-10]MDR8390250.1 hypothetical protein [Aliifodinibius sp. S!AR15-10]
MKKRDASILIVAIVVGFFALSSCKHTTSTELADSLDTVKGVTPIPEAQDVTMHLAKGSNSFFTLSFDGGHELEGWCIEWNEGTSFGLNKVTNLYSTRNHLDWREINYFMNIMKDLRANDPNLTYQDIQVVIWSLIDKPVFDVDKIDEYEHIPGRIYYNGNSYFNVQKVKDIVYQVKQAIANGERVETGVTLVENEGQTIMIGDETAFAVKTNATNDEQIIDSGYSACFDKQLLEDNFFPRWGWTNGPITEGSGSLKFNIYSEVGQCDLNNGTPVGELVVNYDGGTFTANYKMTKISKYTGKPYTMTETHLWVGSERYPTHDGKYSVAPDQYGNVNKHDRVTEFTYKITGLSGPVFFISHASVSGFNP